MSAPDVLFSAPFLAAVLAMGSGALLVGAAFSRPAASREGRMRARLRFLLPEAGEQAVELALERRDAGANRGIHAAFIRHSRVFLRRVGGWAGVRAAFPLSALAGVSVAIAADVIFLSGVPLAAVLGVALGAFMFQRRLESREQTRRLAFLEHLPEAIELIVRAAQAGIPITEALAVAGAEVVEPVGTEFRAIAEKIQLGEELKTALNEVADSVDLVDFDCFVVSLIVQRETGGQLSETLQNLATIIRRRKETRAKSKALTAEGRMTANVIAGLPFVVSGMLSVINPAYMSVMLTDPMGRTMLLVAVGCLTFGLFVIGRLTRAEL
jgi:tight adherence protein B